MQTFLPYPDFSQSVQILDYRRLGKQRVEAYQILRIANGTTPDSRWRNHPAVRMWMGYPEALSMYMDAAIREWVSRGFKNTMLITGCIAVGMPPWIGDERLHSSHRGRLLHKLPEHYSKFGWVEKPIPPEVGYFWPGSDTKI